MANKTVNYNFNKPEITDNFNIDHLNSNLDLIDGALKMLNETKAEFSQIPTSMPANGGNAQTVNGHKVESDVPVGAKFTDTIYSHPTTHPYGMITGAPTSMPANGGNADTVDGWHVNMSINEVGLKPIQGGTADIGVGSSLTAGTLYCVYE